MIPQITQIAANVVDGTSSYNSYILPTIDVDEEAADITKIHRNTNGELIVSGEKVDALSIRDGLRDFCSFLQKHSNSILIAHNGRKFDFPVMVWAASRVGMLDRLVECVFGCVDSLNVFRKVFPKLSSYRQVDLSKALLGDSYHYEAHNAIADVTTLSDMVRMKEVTDNILVSYSFSLTAVHKGLLFSREK